MRSTLSQLKHRIFPDLTPWTSWKSRLFSQLPFPHLGLTLQLLPVLLPLPTHFSNSSFQGQHDPSVIYANRHLQSSPWLYSQQHLTPWPLIQLSAKASTHSISWFSSYTLNTVWWFLILLCWLIFLCWSFSWLILMLFSHSHPIFNTSIHSCP